MCVLKERQNGYFIWRYMNTSMNTLVIKPYT